PEATRIKYLTDGTLIRECLSDPLLSAYSVIMVDEAQDRSIATDMLLALLKKILRKRKNDLRVVISSASLDAERFRTYFASDDAIATAEALGNATILSISGRVFPVDTHYLALPCENYLAASVEAVMNIHSNEPAGDILVFLPGKDDIARALADTHELALTDGRLGSMMLVALSAGLPQEEQKQVFDPTPAGKRKVVLGAIEPQRAVLTPEFGIHLAELPLDPQLGACLLNAAQNFHCLREALAAVAMLAIGNDPFVIPGDQRAEAELDKREFMVQEGDILTFVNALVAYQETPAKLRSQWCRLHFLSSRTLEQADRVSRQLEGYLIRMGYSRERCRQSCGQDFSRLQKCLASGLFANAARLEADGSYRLFRGGPALWIHPSSVLFPETARPKFVVFAEAMETTKLYMRGITAIDLSWLTEVAPHYYTAE
ncbi:hypothetical protein GGI10_005397, partial [Coemansia sp. RSA 2530]